jgi:hypothetical protein
MTLALTPAHVDLTLSAIVHGLGADPDVYVRAEAAVRSVASALPPRRRQVHCCWHSATVTTVCGGPPQSH